MQRAAFEELTPALCEGSLKLLKEQGFTTATPVQCAAIPLLSNNKDVAVEACTGSGKTLAFVLPIVEILHRMDAPLSKHQVGAVIVSPTRELARQIYEVACPYLANVCAAKPMLLVGGTNPADDVQAFKEHGSNVLVGTPGRLNDIMERSKDMHLRTLEVLILDEADRLLGMGFERQLNSIMLRLPKQRRTGLFSATQTEAVQELARAGLRNAVRVAVSQKQEGPATGSKSGQKSLNKTPTALSLEYILAEAEEKMQYLVAFLEQHANQKVIVYFLTCACVDFFTLMVPKLPGTPKKLKLFQLHGRMKQSQREATLASYATTTGGGALFCTDLAARGLDIPDVDWVVQFDPPQDPASFVHRVGRTARMGRSGNALVFLLPHEEAYVEFLARRQVPLVLAAAPPQSAHSAAAICAAAREWSEKDREYLEKGTRAFVSCVRAYKEHQCNYIFRITHLDLGKLGTSFGLLTLPKMKEVKQSKVPIRFRKSKVDPDTVKFKDKAREKQRQRTLAERAKTREAAETAEAAEETEKQARRDKYREEREKEAKRRTAAKRRLQQDRQDMEELEEEYRLVKKLKKKKISETECDDAIAELDEAHEDLQKSRAKPKKKKKTRKQKAQEAAARAA